MKAMREAIPRLCRPSSGGPIPYPGRIIWISPPYLRPMSPKIYCIMNAVAATPLKASFVSRSSVPARRSNVARRVQATSQVSDEGFELMRKGVKVAAEETVLTPRYVKNIVDGRDNTVPRRISRRLCGAMNVWSRPPRPGRPASFSLPQRSISPLTASRSRSHAGSTPRTSMRWQTCSI